MMPVPTFKSNLELARYIDEDHRRGDHAIPAAFLLDAKDRASSETYLSVNSLEVSSMKDIVDVHRRRVGRHVDIAICCNKVNQYIQAGRRNGATINPATVHRWVFQGSAGWEAAFRHREILPHNSSHCGVEFVRILDEDKERRFARRMASSPRYHLFPA
jgi:hypothetical protein